MADVLALTEVDRERIEKWLSRPDLFPPELLDWVVKSAAQYLPLIPVQQLGGYAPDRVESALVATAQSTAESSYVNLATEGPTLTGLVNGDYLLIFGAEFGKVGDPGTGAGRMSFAVNNGGASDNDSILIETGGTVVYHGSTAVRVTLKGTGTFDNANEVKAKYRRDAGLSSTGANPQFQNRFLIAIRAS